VGEARPHRRAGRRSPPKGAAKPARHRREKKNAPRSRKQRGRGEQPRGLRRCYRGSVPSTGERAPAEEMQQPRKPGGEVVSRDASGEAVPSTGERAPAEGKPQPRKPGRRKKYLQEPVFFFS